MATPTKTLYIIYNASGTIMGKLQYGYKKINCPKDADPICAACEITHGGLSLKETPEWIAAKSEIEGEGVKVVQWHRDEMESQLNGWVKKEGVELPVAVSSVSGKEGFEVVMDRQTLGGLGGDAKAFVAALRERGVLNGAPQASL
ncbi:hypothetical protein BCR34DRAFT_577353 [Clohesyomyces aquaticus]|uniref:Uncharacterized protein n=1 Tax=Clohesyomyces aquaticus TaxID=1231657 RepID=A0A1Y1YKD3_9PLEO|nr:hypothetical protein BCR34DRAFT_577353 [Clohesyomyces aquaticus]